MEEFKSISLKFAAVGILPKFLLTIALLIVLYWINKIIVNYIDNINWSSKRTIKFKKNIFYFYKGNIFNSSNSYMGI